MAVTYSTTLQNQIALRVAGVINSALDAGDKIYLDNTWSSGALSAGSAAAIALDHVQQMAQWFSMAGATAAPDAWTGYFVAYAALEFSKAMRPERISMFEKAMAAERETCINSLMRTAIDATTATDGTGAFLLSVQKLRYHVVSYCVRRSPRIFPPIELIDSAIDKVLQELWNGHKWTFRRRQTEMVLVVASPTAPTFTELAASSETFDSSATRKWYYSDDASLGCNVIEWADGDMWAQLKAQWGTETGRPQYLRIQQSGSTKAFQFLPLPDEAYTLRGEAYITGPGSPGSATETTVFDKFPSEFRQVIRDRVLGEVLRLMGDKLGENIWQRSKDDEERLLPLFEDQGDMDTDVSVRDVYGDAAAINGWNGIGGPL